KAKHRPRRHAQVKIFDGGLGPKSFGQAAGFNDGAGWVGVARADGSAQASGSAGAAHVAAAAAWRAASGTAPNNACPSGVMRTLKSVVSSACPPLTWCRSIPSAGL